MTTLSVSSNQIPDCLLPVRENHLSAYYYRDVIDELLKQSSSWEAYWTIEDLEKLIKANALFPVLGFKGGEVVGLVLYSVQRYSQNRVGCKIEFLSCREFFSMAGFFDILETYLFASGFHFIEAIAHPAIAEYAVRKCGFDAPSVYITKTLKEGKEH